MSRHSVPRPHTSARQRRFSLFAVLTVLAGMLSVSTLPTVAPPAAAAIQQPFSASFNAQTNGAITVTGNSQMTCPTAAACTTARNTTPTATQTTGSNNDFTMQFVDNDGVATTTNSTSAGLTLIAGSTVLYANLSWGARTTAGTGGAAAVGNANQIKFRVPGGAYQTLTAPRSVSYPGLAGTPYNSSIDVTALVKAAGNGTYWAADIAAGTGADRYAGWSLTVVYQNPAFPLRDLRVYEGFADVSNGAPVTIPITGLLTPPSGAVNASVGFVVWEGDAGFSGDSASLVSAAGVVRPLSDGSRPTTNFFDSAISDLGNNLTDRSPNYINNLGVDIGRVNASGLIDNGATETNLRVTSSGDVYYPTQLTTQIDLYTPRFNPIAKTVTNLSGHSPAQVGDVLQYDMTFTNTGDDFADNVVVNDVLQPNQTYVPGSLTVVAGTGVGSRTDATGDDVAEYLAASRTVRFRVGTGANATTGGTLAPNATSSLRFQAVVDRAASGTTIPNTPTLDYTARAINNRYTYTGNTVTTPVRALADLSIVKTATQTQTAGRNITYTLAVTNNGPTDASAVVVSDALPAGVGFVSADPPAGASCTFAGSTVMCTAATVANGATLTIPITVAIPPGGSAGSLTNTATVSADTADDVTTNNASSAITTVTRLADVSLTKTGPASIAPGQQVSYTLTATNAGPSTADAVTVVDQLPTGLTFVPGSSSAGCSLSGSTVTCTQGTLAVGASASFTLVATVGSNVAAGTLSNSATVSTTTPESSTANNTSTATTTLAPRADVQIVKSIAASPAVAGRQSVYTLAITNVGPSDAANVTATDTLPASFAVTGVSSTSGNCTVTGQTVNCSFGSVAPNQPISVTIRGQLSPTATGTLANTATVASDTTDPTPGNNTSSTNTPITAIADLALVKTSTPGTIVFGSPVTYSLTASNAGPSAATGTVTSDPLPAGFTFASSPDNCTASANNTVTCSLGTLAVGTSRTVTFVANTPASGDGATTNTASVSSDATDPVTANNTASSRADGTAIADLSVLKTTVTTAPDSGGTIQYRVAVTNNGPSDATAVVLSDPLPTGITFTSGSSDTGVTCTAPGGTVTCALGTLASGATATVTIDGAIGNNTRNTSTNTASVSSATTDPSQGNNSNSSTVQIRAVADVAVTLVPEQTNYLAGQIVNYILRVTNNGPATSNGVVVTGSVPPGMTPILGSSGGACSVSGGTVTCTLGNLPNGAVISIPLQARIDPQTPAGPITGTATVGSTTFDPTAANNTSTPTIQVTTQAELSIAKTVTPSPLTPGSTGVYQITVTNDGPSDAVAPVVTDTLAAALTGGAPSASIGTCTLTGQAVSCTADRLAAGQSMVVRIPVTVAAQATGTVPNTAAVTSGTTDPTPTDNSVSITTPLAPSADLTLRKTADRTGLVAGSSVTYTLTLTNAGPSGAPGSTITDTLPAGMTVLPDGVSGPAGACSVTPDSRTVNCVVGTLAPGQFVVVTIEALVSATQAAGSTLANTATAASTVPDPDATNNSSTSSLPVTASADVRVTKRAATDTFVAGGQGSYLVSVENIGPSTARSIVLTDPLAAGATFVAATSSTGTCSAAGGTVTCELGDLSPGENATVQIDVLVADDIAGSTLSNRASAVSAPATGSPTPDPSTGNNSSTAAVPVVEVADLSLTKVRTSGPVVAGGNVAYRVTVTNAGPSVSTATTISDPIPAGTTYVSAAPSTGGTCALTAGVLGCSWPTTSVGASHSVLVTIAVPTTATIGAQLTNTATATSNGNDPTPTSATDSSPITASADLSTVKQLISGTPTAGGPIRWSITVTNAGPSIATGSTVTDTVPAGVTLTGTPTSSQGTCTVTGAQISCATGSIAPGTPVVITVTGTLDPAFTGASVSNSATASSPVADPNAGNDTGSVTSPVNTSADLSITKTGTPTRLTAGSPVTWTIAVSNAVGPSAARTVVVTDTLPDGVTAVTATVPGGTCAVDQGVLTCSLPVIAFGDTASITVSGTVLPSYTGASLDNTASVRANTPDPNGGNNTDASSNPVQALADLAVVVSGPATAAPGSPVTFTALVTNNGPSDSSGASITVTLPAGLLDPQVSGPGGTCTVTVTAGGSTAVCPVGTLADGASSTITITGTIDPAATGSITVTAASSGGTPDPLGGNNSDDAVTTLVPSADLSVTKRLVGTAVAGQSVEWQLDYRNDGPSTARAVVITDQLPAGISAVTATINGTSCTVTGADVSCAIGDLPPSVPGQVLVRGILAADYAPASLANTAAISSPTTDPDGTDNADTSTSTVVRSADLQVGKRITSGTPVAGAPISYEVTVTNNGPSISTGTTLADSLPSVITGITAGSDQGTCSVAGQDVSCGLGTLTVGQTVTVTLSGTLSQAFGQTVGNTAGASSDVTDPIAGNNSSTATGSVDDEADLSLTKTGPATVTAGSAISWTVTITNAGPSDARAVTLADTIPSGVSGVTVTADNGAVCADPANCVLGTVPNGGRVVVTLSGTVASDYAGTAISNLARVSTDSSDPNGGNDTETALTQVTRATTLTVDKTVTPDPLVPGSPAEYRIVVTNTGPSDSPVFVSDSLPAGLTIADPGPTPSTGSCDVNDLDVDCAFGTVVAGTSRTVTIPVVVGAGYSATTVANTATATTPYGPDASGTSTADVTPQADLTVTKTGPAAVLAGEPIAWNVTVANNGPSVARAVVFTDTLPAGIVDPDVNSSTGSCTITGLTISCDLGDVAVGDPATVSITITGEVAPTFTGTSLANTGRVTSPTAEPPNTPAPGDPPAPDGRTDTATTAVSRSADVQVFKTTSTPASAPGEAVNWTITVRNNGPSAATGVQVADTLPAGLTDVQFTAPAGTTCTADGLCTIGTLLPGVDEQVEIGVSATVDPTVTATSLRNSVTSPADAIDPVPGNNTSESTVSLVPRADLAIAKTVTDPAEAGGSVGWEISVVNGGPSVARDVVVSDPLPAGLSDVRVTPPTGATCIIRDVGGTSSVSCDLGDLAPGTAARATIGITADVAPGVTGDLSNTATVSSTTPDANTADNTATAIGPVGVVGGVSVTKTGPASVPAGGQVRWTVTVRGEGPATARDVRLEDPAPAGLTDVSYVPAAGTCTQAGVCDLGDVAPGATVVVTVQATVPAGFADDDVTNTATVTSSTPDPDPSDNTASATSSIDKRADLVLFKRALEKEITAGGTVTWLITVTNKGPAADPDVTVVDRLPEGLTAIEPLPAGCSAAGRVVTCSVGALADQQSIELRIVTRVAADLAGAVVNDASVEGANTDPRPGSNDGGGSVTVLPPTGPPPTPPTLPTVSPTVSPTVPTTAAPTGTTPTAPTVTTPPVTTPPGGLPNTGAPVSAMLWWALGLLLAGAALVFVQRRRRQI